MTRTRVWLATLLLLASCSDSPSSRSSDQRVEASAYQNFYVWPGVHPAAGLRSKTLYLLDGEVRRDGAATLQRLRMGAPRLPDKTTWLVVRADRLDWGEATYADIFADLRRWQAAGNQVAGLQVDFDAATRGIGGYARFLTELRARLPRNWRLSVTGLLDWSAHGDPKELARLKGIVDEVVIQTYQGRETIPGYERYLRQMDGFPIPFRIALVEGGLWQPSNAVARQPNFRGYVVFLLARVGKRDR